MLAVARCGAAPADARHELPEPERLHDVVVGADFEEPHAVELVLAGSDDDDRNLGAGADAPTHLPTVEIGEPEIEQHEVGGLRRANGLGAGADPGRSEPFELQALHERYRDRVVILDHEHRSRFS